MIQFTIHKSEHFQFHKSEGTWGLMHAVCMHSPFIEVNQTGLLSWKAILCVKESTLLAICHVCWSSENLFSNLGHQPLPSFAFAIPGARLPFWFGTCPNNFLGLWVHLADLNWVLTWLNIHRIFLVFRRPHFSKTLYPALRSVRPASINFWFGNCPFKHTHCLDSIFGLFDPAKSVFKSVLVSWSTGRWQVLPTDCLVVSLNIALLVKAH